MRLEKDKGFYKNIFAIAIPIALQNLITFTTNMLDTIMLGRVEDGETLLSAASLGSQPFFILSMVCFGIAGATMVLASQYWGKKDLHTIRKIFSIIIKITFGLSAVIAAICILFPEFILSLYSNSPDIIAQGASYLKIMGFAYIPFSLTTVILCSLRSVEVVNVAVPINLTSFCINIVLNYILIFGKCGFPALGIRGAAIASLIARLVEFIIMLIYVFGFEKRLRLRPKHLKTFSTVLAKDLFRYGSPVLINEIMWSAGITLQAAILGHIRYSAGDPVAANSIASMIQQLSTIIIFGVANAAAVLIGRTIGEKNIEKAKMQARTFQLLAIVMGAGATAFILALKNVVLNFYILTPETRALSSQLIIVIAIITFFVSTSGIDIVGILRGGGDTKFGLIAELTILWAVATPLCLVSAFVFELPVPIVLLFMKIDEPIKNVVCTIRLKGDKWLRSVTRENVN